MRTIALTMLAAGVALVGPAGHAQDAEPEFTEAFLSDPDNIQHGRELFQEQCSRCHGKGAYPGKAPKLKPRNMPPEEIYAKVTYGFGKMPPWEDVFTNEERADITAYMKSGIFSN